ncbi:MAG: alpha/beta hydrolase [Pseudomonadota bacterium]
MSNVKNLVRAAAITAAMLTAASAASAAETTVNRPTIVMAHGAFAASDSWDAVSGILLDAGYPVISIANPLRGVAADAAHARSIIDTIDSDVVLVGHSYGGPVIDTAANGATNVKSLVFVASFAPEKGETIAELSGKFPGGTLGEALAAPVPLGGGVHDLYIDQAKFHAQFAADLPIERTRLMAVAQRPVTDAALNEPLGDPSWKVLPSYHVFGTADKNIPVAAMQFMADRAGSRKTVTVEGASHVVMISHPQAVADLIIEAANAN